MTDHIAEVKISPRRWWVALLLVPFTLGVGYLYVGRPRRALAYAVLSIVMFLLVWHGLWGWIAKPFVAFFFTAVGLILILFSVVDAIRIARLSSNYLLRWYNRWWVYLAFAILPAVAANLNLVVPAVPPIILAAHAFSISSNSGLPTVRLGEHMIADLRAYDQKGPERGDLIVFALPSDPTVVYFKRVAGIPGDRVQMKGGILFIDEQEAKREFIDRVREEDREYERYRETVPNGRSYFVLDLRPDGMADNTEVFEVPPDDYFVLGDNRDNSTDSRFSAEQGGVGYVPRANLIGKATWIDWSSDLSRIGTSLE